MISMNKYKLAEEYIHVTPEMKQRLLDSLKNAKKPEKRPRANRGFIKQLTAIAACAAIIICGAGIIPEILKSSPRLTVGEVAESVGFSVYAPSELPKGYELSDYSASGNSLKLDYESDGAEISFSMSEVIYDISGVSGTESDNSTDDKYLFVTPEYIMVGDLIVEFYGSDGLYSRVSWSDGGYDFRMDFSDPMTAEQITSIIASVDEVR